MGQYSLMVRHFEPYANFPLVHSDALKATLEQILWLCLVAHLPVLNRQKQITPRSQSNLRENEEDYDREILSDNSSIESANYWHRLIDTSFKAQISFYTVYCEMKKRVT